MNEKFLKARIPHDLYEALQARAAIEGLRLSTYVREVLARDTQAISVDQALIRIESVLAQRPAPDVPASALTGDHEMRHALLEVRLLVRELAMASNAQILGRVAAQLKTHPYQSN